MKEFDYTLNIKMGIHARPAALIADRAKFVDEKISVSFNGKTADASKIMKLVSLRAKKGDTVHVTVEGPEEEKVALEMEKLFKENL